MTLYIIAGAVGLLLVTVIFFKVKIGLLKRTHEKEKEKLEKEKQLLIKATEEYAENMTKYVSKLEKLRRLHEKDVEILRIDDDGVRLDALYNRVRELTKQAKSDRDKNRVSGT